MVREREEPPRSNRGPAAAADNRRALVAAARDVFAEQGLAAPFSAVARRAGVGQGSLYRHFPTKIDLAAAVFEDDIDEIERIADLDDSTLGDLFDRVIAQSTVSAAFLDAVAAARDHAAVRHVGERMTEVTARLLARDQSAGRVDEGVEVIDVVLAVSMLARAVADALPAERRDVAHRAHDIIVRGLLPRA